MLIFINFLNFFVFGAASHLPAAERAALHETVKKAEKERDARREERTRASLSPKTPSSEAKTTSLGVFATPPAAESEAIQKSGITNENIDEKKKEIKALREEISKMSEGQAKGSKELDLQKKHIDVLKFEIYTTRYSTSSLSEADKLNILSWEWKISRAENRVVDTKLRNLHQKMNRIASQDRCSSDHELARSIIKQTEEKNKKLLLQTKKLFLSHAESMMASLERRASALSEKQGRAHIEIQSSIARLKTEIQKHTIDIEKQESKPGQISSCDAQQKWTSPSWHSDLKSTQI